jgi:RimJ/RimL family protein N-acetyltransferase
MYSDIIPDYENQLRWFNKIDLNYYWVIEIDSTPIGVINLADIDFKNTHTSFGYYIGEQEYRFLGGMILPYFYNYIFDRFPINKIIAEVFAENEDVISIHLSHGYRRVGTLSEHVYKNEKYHDIKLLELKRKTWENLTRYKGLVAKLG